MSGDWTEIYRPHGLAEVVGNPKAVEDLKAWADAWVSGRPVKRAAVLIGTPGTGKTSAALALAADYGWDVIEMNASDQRNADAIRSIAMRGALGQTFTPDGDYHSTKEGKLKLIILDEADNISGREDRGGVPAIVEVVRTTKQPIILIVNDWYALSKKSSVLKSQTEQIKFSRIKTVTVRGVLRKIARDQGVAVSDRALELLAENSGGTCARPSRPAGGRHRQEGGHRPGHRCGLGARWRRPCIRPWMRSSRPVIPGGQGQDGGGRGNAGDQAALDRGEPADRVPRSS